MSENRRGGLSEAEITKLAELISVNLQANAGCRLTEEQQTAVIELITQKKKVVKITLWFIGALILWVAKDIYLYITNHIVFGWGR